uniref:C-type lectin domain-containing protein n=1 Tax=Strigops habroptila TaxID=2489341 RepID=A0A672TW42_STRHB
DNKEEHDFRNGLVRHIFKESKTWKVAQQICEMSSRGAHLLDIGSEEEHGFIMSYLQTVSQIIMLWMGLNDLRVSMFYRHHYYMCGSRRILIYRTQFSGIKVLLVDRKEIIIFSCLEILKILSRP